MSKKLLLVLIGAAVVLLIIFVVKRNQNEKLQKQTRFLLDTYCTISAPGPGGAANKAISLALDRIEEINSKFNVLNPKSPLYEFNNKNVPISDKEIVDLCRVAMQVSAQSGGNFDITVYPLVKAWGFYDNSPHVPGKKEIAGCLKMMGNRYLAIENGKLVKLKNSVKIDLGAIAKGYAVGEALKVLKKEGIKSALIDAGGDIYALGKLNGKPWKVGIRNPREDGVIGVIEASDLSLATSGDYERVFFENGVRYHHIMDPKTGYPAGDLASVTVISHDPTLADAWSTALFVLGKEKGMETVEKSQVAEAVMVTKEGKVIYSSGLKENLKVIKKEKENDSK